MTTVATCLAKGSVQECSKQLTDTIKRHFVNSDPSLIFVFASTKQPLTELCQLFANNFQGAVILSSSTSGEFIETGDDKGSVAAIALSGEFKVSAGIGTGLKNDAEGAISQALSNHPSEESGYPYKTAIMLIDPLAGNGEEATLLAAAMLGEQVQLAGGAAADDLAMKSTHVGLGTNVSTDAVVIAQIYSKSPLGIGVCHGHIPISAPMRVTKAKDNIVQEVDGRPAWQVWVEKTRDIALRQGIHVDTLSAGEIGAYLLRYEAGLSVGDDYKIRAPLAKNDDGSIAFACGIPEGTVFRITESIESKQLQSAQEAARQAREKLKGEAAAAVVFDCICRNLILTNEFSSAIRAISQELGNVPLAGFETYGEIALNIGDMSGFHNTTSVVLAFPK